MHKNLKEYISQRCKVELTGLGRSEDEATALAEVNADRLHLIALTEINSRIGPNHSGLIHTWQEVRPIIDDEIKLLEDVPAPDLPKKMKEKSKDK